MWNRKDNKKGVLSVFRTTKEGYYGAPSGSSQNPEGFTILELMIGIFILMVAVTGIYVLVSRLFIYNRYLSSKMTAAYLTQEGIEVVRGIRDANWINSNEWTAGIFCCEIDNSCPFGRTCQCDGCEADYESTRLYPASGDNLEIDSNDFFSYPASSQWITDFERIIGVRKHNEEYIEVCVTTQWGPKTDNYMVRACDKLYNWFEI